MCALGFGIFLLPVVGIAEGADFGSWGPNRAKQFCENRLRGVHSEAELSEVLRDPDFLRVEVKEDPETQDPVNELPPEMIAQIADNLGFRDICRAGGVSRQWRFIFRDQWMLRTLFKKMGLNIDRHEGELIMLERIFGEDIEKALQVMFVWKEWIEEMRVDKENLLLQRPDDEELETDLAIHERKFIGWAEGLIEEEARRMKDYFIGVRDDYQMRLPKGEFDLYNCRLKTEAGERILVKWVKSEKSPFYMGRIWRTDHPTPGGQIN